MLRRTTMAPTPGTRSGWVVVAGEVVVRPAVLPPLPAQAESPQTATAAASIVTGRGREPTVTLPVPVVLR